MASTLVYLASLAGAAALYLLARPGPRAARALGVLLGLGALAWLLVEAASAWADSPDERTGLWFMIFAGLALASAVRMITITRPVYCALYFVMVVLASAGLFLLLEAEFMAFALVIVYAGAILVTYLFVLMLAQQSPATVEGDSAVEYDRVPREPAAAATVGFIMLALLCGMIFGGAGELPAPVARSADAAAWSELERMPDRLEQAVRAVEPEFQWPPTADETGHIVRLDATGAFVIGAVVGSAEAQRIDLPREALPENIHRVGWALVHTFPVSLELAGVILLMAMFGAVVLARRQIELGEDEKRQAAGLGRLMDDGEDRPRSAPGPGGRP
jgi:NADH-quinone oxidoreductase subunit J